MVKKVNYPGGEKLWPSKNLKYRGKGEQKSRVGAQDNAGLGKT